MNTLHLKQSLLAFLTFAVVCIPVSIASAASVSVQSISPGTTVFAKTNFTFSIVTSGFSIPMYHVTDSFSGSTLADSNVNFGGQFSWTPVVSDVGTHTLNISVNDANGNTANVSQVIIVLPPPSISIQSVSPGNEVMPGTKFSFVVVPTGFTNPQYIAGDSVGGSTVSQVKIDSAGNFVWTPDALSNGEHTITVYASDSLGHSASANVSVRVGAGPSLAVMSGFNGATVSPGQAVSFTLSPSAYTPTEYSLADAFTGVSTLTNGNINSTGVFHWVPTAADAGTHIITITGQVGPYGASASTKQTINVLGLNGVLPPAPIAALASTSTGMSSAITVADLLSQLALLQSQASGSAVPSTTSTQSSGIVFVTYLRPGASGDEVLKLQQTLAKLGHFTVEPNGYFGPSTIAAVKKFQAAKGLSQLGVVGPATRAALNAIAGTQTSTAATQSKFIFDHFMGMGDDDTPDVIELQKRLTSLGFFTGELSGYYGTTTETAVKNYQASKNLPVTGYVASNTRAALNK